MLNWFQKNTDVKILILICAIILLVLLFRTCTREYMSGLPSWLGGKKKGGEAEANEGEKMEAPGVTVNIVPTTKESYTIRGIENYTEYYEPRTHNSAISLEVKIKVPNTDNALNINSIKLKWNVKDGIEHTWENEDFKGKVLTYTFPGDELGDADLSTTASKLIVTYSTTFDPDNQKDWVEYSVPQLDPAKIENIAEGTIDTISVDVESIDSTSGVINLDIDSSKILYKFRTANNILSNDKLQKKK